MISILALHGAATRRVHISVRGCVVIGTMLLAVLPARPATVSGTFRFCDPAPERQVLAVPPDHQCDCDGDGQMDGVLRPMVSAKVEIWHRGVYVWNTWANIGTVETDDTGYMHFEDTRGDGTYGVRVFAANAAAVVFPNDEVYTPFTLPFHREPGQPGPVIQQRVYSANDQREFSFDFTDRWSAQHYNIAETVRLGFNYATARRDPSESDPIQQVRVYNIGFGDLAQQSHYNPIDNAIRIRDTHMSEDFVILHEYAHYLEASISSFAWMPSGHDGCNPNMYPGVAGDVFQHAWMEGFADYFAQAVARSLPNGTLNGTEDEGTSSVRTLEQHPRSECSAAPPAGVENFVAAVLWDLVDDPNAAEPFDFAGDQDVEVFQIFDKELDTAKWPTIFDLRDAWIARGLDRAALDRLLSQFNIVSLPDQTAEFVGQSVPAVMIPGQPYSVSVTMRNTGVSTWCPSLEYVLGSQIPQNSATWGVQRVAVPYEVRPGELVTFTFTVIAPAVPGPYRFQWRMLQQSVEWFGDLTPETVVGVYVPRRSQIVTTIQGAITETNRTITVWAVDAVTGAALNGSVTINGSVGTTGTPITYKACTTETREIEIINGKPKVIVVITQVPCQGIVNTAGYSDAEFGDSYHDVSE